MVEVRYRGQRGNQLFQYCLGRILAEKRGYALRAPPIEGFAATTDVVSGREALLPWPRWRGHDINFDAAMRGRFPRRFTLDGYFLNYKYYQAHADRLRAWIGPSILAKPTTILAEPPGPEDLLVMVRLRDFVTCGAALSWTYFETVLRTARYRRLYITSDELDHPFIQRFAPYQPILVDADAFETLRLAARFKKLAISNSTFGWWIAFTGEAEEVWYPMPRHVPEGAWALNRLVDGVDLRVDDPRYHYVYGAPVLIDDAPPVHALLPLATAPVDLAMHADFHRLSKAYWMAPDDSPVCP